MKENYTNTLVAIVVSIAVISFALMIKHNITMAEIPNIQLPGIEMPKFDAGYFGDDPKDEKEKKPKECPKCGFAW